MYLFLSPLEVEKALSSVTKNVITIYDASRLGVIKGENARLRARNSVANDDVILCAAI